MKRLDALYSMTSPVAGAVLKKWPAANGGFRQGWGGEPTLYFSPAGQIDFMHTTFGGHVGIDIAGQHRTPILAAHNGVISTIRGDRTNQGGLEVWLQSDPYEDKVPDDSMHMTVYCHLDEYV